MESEGKRVEWEARVMAWKAIGLTQKEYCLREGIGFSGMRYWSARTENDKKQLTNLLKKQTVIFHVLPNLCLWNISCGDTF